MAFTHKGLDSRLLGRVDSDEDFTMKIKHVMNLKRQGYPVSWFRDRYNRVRVKRGGQWWVIDDLAKYEQIYNWE